MKRRNNHNLIRFTGLILLAVITPASAQYTTRQIADESMINRTPVISDTGLVAWQAFRIGVTDAIRTDIYIYKDGETRSLTANVDMDPNASNNDPQLSSNTIVWVATTDQRAESPLWQLVDPPLDTEIPERDARFRAYSESDQAGGALSRQWFERVGQSEIFNETPPNEDGTRPPRRTPSGNNEIMLWDGDDVMRITDDNRNDLGPGFWGDMIAWQKARGWPFGWEIMVWVDGARAQLTTNYHYDMAPRVHNKHVVWYGWDGTDYEIYLYDHEQQEISQITDNNYDDVSPKIWDGTIVWEGYASVGADIFMYRDGETTQLSDNIDDDINPRIWNGQVVWQSFDGDFYQIFHYDGNQSIPLTSTRYDNINPDIRDGLITWMGYEENMDAEVFVWTGGPNPIQLTENDYEDQNPRTAGGRVVWQADYDGKSHIFLAEPE